MDGPILIYDGDCAFCQRCVDLGARLPAPVVARPYQFVDVERLGLSLDQVRTAAWWVPTQGAPRRGHRAVAAVLHRQPGRFWRAVGALLDHPPLSWLAAGVYAVVARYRHRLPVGTAQCRLADRPSSVGSPVGKIESRGATGSSPGRRGLLG